MTNLSTDQIKAIHGNGGYWCQGDAVYIKATDEMEAIASYRLKMSRGGIGITSNLNTLDAFKYKGAIEAKNVAYSERNKMLAAFCGLALASGFTVGIEEHENVVFLEMPKGQVSFHVRDSEMHLFEFLPIYQGKWNRRDTETKWQVLLE